MSNGNFGASLKGICAINSMNVHVSPILFLYFMLVEKCYHHYDGCIVPQSADTETPWYSNPINYFFKSGASGAKQFDDLRCQSLLHYLKGFSENLQGPACIDVLCQSKFAVAVEQISGVYKQIKDMRLRQASYVAGSPDLVPCKSVSQVHALISSYQLI